VLARLRLWWRVWWFMASTQHPRLYRVVRWLQGARRPQLGGLRETHGIYAGPGVRVEFSGACPVQGYGVVDGHECYYRSRGEGWSLDIYPRGVSFADNGDLPGVAPEFLYQERPYIWPDGGWVHADVSRACIARAVKAWRKRLALPTVPAEGAG
jgi:hypothetical protein